MPTGRARKDSNSDAATEDQGTVGTFETLRDEGEHFVHVQQYAKAIDSFTKALEMRNGDKTCLVIRAKCYLMLGNSELALTDADAALEQDEDGKRDIRALNMKAEALYQKGDFETALVFYHRGNKLRPELQEFRLGIQKCEEAIDNSIGTPNAVQLEASGDLSYFYKQDEKKQKGYTKVNQPQKKEVKKDRRRPNTGTNSKTMKELLGELYEDKEFLEKMFDSLSNSNSNTDDYIKGRACDGLEYLTNRSDFWRQQKPMYARKRDKQARSAKNSAGPRGSDPMRYVLIKFEEIDTAQSEGRYQESLEKCQHALKKVEELPEGSLKNKPDVIANLYSSMGNAYLEMNKYSSALKFHTKDLNIARDNNLEQAESRALDNLGRAYARMGKFEDAIDIWKGKLPNSKTPLESTWLYHEIGRCHLELGEYQDAKEYGEKSVEAAVEADDSGWQLHARVLVAQSEVKCGEYTAASDSFSQALELAVDQNDKAAQSAIKKALEEVNSRLGKDSHHDEKKDGSRRDEKKDDSRRDEKKDDSRRNEKKGDSHRDEKKDDSNGEKHENDSDEDRKSRKRDASPIDNNKKDSTDSTEKDEDDVNRNESVV